jgi:gluconokinase
LVVVIMGVSGVGKTTVGRALATRVGWTFLEADDDHSPAAKARMAKGIPLTDADRAPWLERVRSRMIACSEQGESIVLACSALKRAYRDYLRNVPDRVVFVQLMAPREVLTQRLASRASHFAGVSLLDSQLEAQDAGEDAIVIDATQDVDEIVNAIVASLDIAG